ncbi:hypothetical protein SSPO_080850 [Streptomyces antimycoticus]|uniref:Uncharacterized protein n=1 Tax=Streptomyces antimycoticus TaxID=68175 RepID=A0A499VGT1_9ACTN|nr:hypothetical protein [Streptomyces antimycoticus]BBJ45367.1 hypothetical protein SSPO_080850 [Streptomyces antimycoticus]
MAEHTSAVKAVDHATAGALVFDATLLPLPEHPGHHLILHNPRPGTDTQHEERDQAVVVGLSVAEHLPGLLDGRAAAVPIPISRPSSGATRSAEVTATSA